MGEAHPGLTLVSGGRGEPILSPTGPIWVCDWPIACTQWSAGSQRILREHATYNSRVRIAEQSIAQHGKQGLNRYSQGSQFVVYSFTYITCDFSSFPRYVPPGGTPPAASLHSPCACYPLAKHQGITHWPHSIDLSSPRPQAIFHTFTLPLPLHFYRRRFLTRFPRL